MLDDLDLRWPLGEKDADHVDAPGLLKLVVCHQIFLGGCDEVALLGSRDLFCVRHPDHPFSRQVRHITEAVFDGLMNVHLKGPLFLTQALLPLLADGGAIVNVSSATTRVATVGVAPYAAMKGGLDVLTRYMAKEFGPRGIRANSVSPGAIRTELGDSALDKHPEFAQMLADQTALGRVGEAVDVAGVIASLLLPDNAWINAQRIEVGGGYCI